MFVTPDSPQEGEISRKVICQNSGRASFVVQVRYTDGILSFCAFDRCAARVLEMSMKKSSLLLSETISTVILFN